MAMTWQSLSCLTQLPSASLTAFCSFAAFSASPGRPAAPTATAFHGCARVGRTGGVRSNKLQYSLLMRHTKRRTVS
jgi:hypothetical protein